MNYITENTVYYKLSNKDTGEYIGVGALDPNQVLSTIHTVSFVTKEEYDELNKEELRLKKE